MNINFCLKKCSELIAHVVFHFCGAVDDECYFHEKESRVYFCVNAPYFDSTLHSGDSCYTILSTRLYVCEVLANHGRSCDKTNVVRCIAIITVLSATITVEMSTTESRCERRVSMQPLNKSCVFVAVATYTTGPAWPAGPSAGLTYSCECDNSCHVSVLNFGCALLCSFLSFVYVSIIYAHAH